MDRVKYRFDVSMLQWLLSIELYEELVFKSQRNILRKNTSKYRRDDIPARWNVGTTWYTSEKLPT